MSNLGRQVSGHCQCQGYWGGAGGPNPHLEQVQCVKLVGGAEDPSQSDNAPHDFCTYKSFDNYSNACNVTSVRTHFEERQHTILINDSSNVGEDPSVNFSDKPQYDGADSLSGESINDSVHSYNSENEVDSHPVRAVLIPSTLQGPAGTPLQLEVDVTDQTRTPSCIPLCAVTNPRSAWNKIHNIHTFLRQIGPDIMILSEHWGRKKTFEKALGSQHFKVKESSRGIRGIPTKGRNGKATTSVTGGGVAIVYREENFAVEDAGIEAPEGIESVWVILTHKKNRCG